MLANLVEHLNLSGQQVGVTGLGAYLTDPAPLQAPEYYRIGSFLVARCYILYSGGCLLNIDSTAPNGDNVTDRNKLWHRQELLLLHL